jgi:general secretion pathway protein D
MGGAPTPGGGGPIPGGGEGVQIGAGAQAVKIVADKVKNALVIQAKPSDYRTVESAIRKLDIIPLQVLIEATIFEVTLNDTLRYGVEWFFKFGSSKVVFSSTGDPRAVPSSSSTRLSDQVFSLFPGFSYIATPTQDSVKAVINALDEVSDVNIISSPQVFVLDNQTAKLTVGDQVPVTTQSAQGIFTATSPIVNQVQYRDTGVILEVTPRVNPGGLVTMEISQEVSRIGAGGQTTVQEQTPTINQRKVESTVSVQGGETVALGGLIQDRRDNRSRGLPFLSRLPLIGWLFGTKSDVAERTELLVLMTPRVVGNAEQARQVTQELRSRLRTIAPLEQRVR